MDPNRNADPIGAGGRGSTSLPRRRSDRIADLVAWGLSVLALGTLLVAILVGITVHGDITERAVEQSRERTPITVVLTEDAHVVPESSGRVTVGVRWTGADGAEQVGRTDVVAPLRAGDPAPAWVTGDGRLVGAPLTAAEAVIGAAATATGTFLVGVLAVLGVGMAASRAVDRLHAAEWEREWRRVGPAWRSPR
ncbi:MAG: hypothetical protein OJJ54_02140 [Pseudonocardia sp.]|nr:hypothetical protein [Pseudonocardia sp.]